MSTDFFCAALPKAKRVQSVSKEDPALPYLGKWRSVVSTERFAVSLVS